jgi:hypothetical protein
MTPKKASVSPLWGKWSKHISAAMKDYSGFHTSGDRVVDTYRIEQQSSAQKDRYNILYSITETIKPSMYSQTPKPEVKRRHTDRKNPIVLGATLLMESCVQYSLDEQDFDDVVGSTVEDLLLPGIGVAWLRYEPTIVQSPALDEYGSSILDEKGKPLVNEDVTYEKVVVEYLYWKDFLTSKGRRWSELWWVAKKVYLDKEGVVKQFGKDIANKCRYSSDGKEGDNAGQSIEDKQIAVWEIWDKKSRKVIWFSEGYTEDVMKVSDDFLKLREFFPCPRPLRAVTTNNKFVPRPFFSQYQPQADELNDITFRIRKLVDALRVVGVYDGSVPALQSLLTGEGNKMIPVDNWAVMADKGGIKGTVDFFPIQEVANVLLQLYDARERVKGEIYEITGWSDIIRGVSKASETLGAQQIKAEWAGARLKLLQKDVQRFVRDIFRLIGELCAEHFSDEMLMLMAGYEPNPETPEGMQEVQIFKEVTNLIKSEKDRCALIGVESDSTLLPDEANDRKERMEFLGSAGAFLQQAVPAAKQNPALGPLLGQIIMFAVRGFRSARSLEASFEQYVATMDEGSQAPKNDEASQDTGNQAVVQAKIADTQAKTGIAQQKLAQEAQAHQEDLQMQITKEQNRHSERMIELQLKEREIVIQENQLQLDSAKHMADTRNTEIGIQLDQQNRLEDRIDAAHEQTETGPLEAGETYGEGNA